MKLKKLSSIPLITLLLSILVMLTPSGATAAGPADIGEGVRAAILALPHYGVFDLISFQVVGSTVTLGGDVYQASLRKDAERVVSEVPGVREVVNKIEALPTSMEDDRLRAAVFHAVYTDDFLSRYGTPHGPAGGARRLWGRRFGAWRGFRDGRWGGAPFLGMEPLGNYAIHIIVDGGNVTLFGVVDNEADRDRAVLEARGVFGVHDVDSEIQVDSER